MRNNFKTIAGMAICILGALAASSCSKDEFFGLEDAEYLDYSAKYEIAMSQEYADYAIACFNLVESMNNPIDTTEMIIQGEMKGKPIYTKNDSISPLIDLLNNLKKVYPKLEKADKIDLDEIHSIALSKNEALKDIASKMVRKTTKYYEDRQSGRWLYSVAESYYGQSGWGSPWLDVEGWWLTAYDDVYTAINEVIYRCSETYGCYSNGGGLIFDDASGVSMVTGIYSGEWWPSVVNSGSPQPEADFIFMPNVASLSDLWYEMGSTYWSNNRRHYVLNSNGVLTTVWY